VRSESTTVSTPKANLVQRCVNTDGLCHSVMRDESRYNFGVTHCNIIFETLIPPRVPSPGIRATRRPVDGLATCLWCLIKRHNNSYYFDE
jgi:hypothetical protein